MRDPGYLECNATTPVAPEVLDAMLPWLRDQFGNPSSTHAYGRRAAQAVATARRQVADLIGAEAQEIVLGAEHATAAAGVSVGWSRHRCLRRGQWLGPARPCRCR